MQAIEGVPTRQRPDATVSKVIVPIEDLKIEGDSEQATRTNLQIMFIERKVLMMMPTNRVLGFSREIDFGRLRVSICCNRCLAKVL